MARKAKIIDEFRVYDLPLHFPVLLLDGEGWRISDVLSGRLHFHNCLEIGVCHSDGGVLVFEGGKEIAFRAGDVSCIPRHVPHTTCSAKGRKSMWSYLFVDLETLLASFLPEHAAQIQMPSLLSQSQHPRIHFLACSIMDEIKHQHENHEAVIKSLFHVLYFDLLRLEEMREKTGDARKSTFALKPALEYIRRHYDQPIRVEALADMCHMSETNFRRRFVSVIGMSPHSFLNRTRVNQACALLVSTEKPIHAIAEEVGFINISCFNRNFSKVMGMPANAYRVSRPNDTVLQRKHILQYKGWTAAEAQPEFRRYPEPEEQGRTR